MRRSWILVVVCVWLVAGNAWGQSCADGGTIWSHPGTKPSFLALIIGSHDHPGQATWESMAKKLAADPQSHLGQRSTALLHANLASDAMSVISPAVSSILADSAADSMITDQKVNDLEVAAMAALSLGKLDQAGEYLAKATGFPKASQPCRMRITQLLVHYLQGFGMKAPLFAHFNGGFYNYLNDSLHWSANEPDGNGYLMGLNVVALALRLDHARQPLYLELLGDLLSKEPNRFNANYMAALAYLRAGQILGGQAEAIYDRKAMFALEAPRQAEIRFNQYRFTQLKKALQADVDSAALRQNAFEAQEASAIQSGQDPLARFAGAFSNELSAAAFEETDFGQLPAILKKSKSQIDAREAEVKRYAGDVDLKKEVKKDSRFNTFALFLILTIVGAVVFIWRKVRQASR